MTKSPYGIDVPCGYCGRALEIDASYMNRKYHKYEPFNCGQRHNTFNAKIRRGLASDSKFVVRFCKWAVNQIKADIVTEFQVDPLLNVILRNKFYPMIKAGRRKQK